MEIVEGDVEDEASVRAAMQGCAFAFYLVHSMVTAGKDYAATDRRAARTFAVARRIA